MKFLDIDLDTCRYGNAYLASRRNCINL